MKLDKFYEKYSSFVLGIIQSVIKSKPQLDANDINQEFWISKINSRTITKIIENTTERGLGYLVNSAKNYARDELRKEKAQKNLILKPLEIKEDISKQSKYLICLTEDDCTETCKSRIEKIRMAIKGSELREKVFELWYDGMSNGEIADNLEISTKQVEQLKYRIRKIAKQ